MVRIKNDTLAFEPGKNAGYSNTGFLVLGKVIEQVTGQDYFEYVRKHIYEPAGMTNTDSYELDKVNSNLAEGYIRVRTSNGEVWGNNLFLHIVKGGPAGGGYSTVEDLLKFVLALRSGKLLSSRYVEMLISARPELDELDAPPYGYGFEIGKGTFGHGGGAPGIGSMLMVYPKENYVVAILSNYDLGYMPVMAAVQELLPISNDQAGTPK